MRAGYHTGQGVVYRLEEDGCYIVTAGHVTDGLQESGSGTVVFADGTEASAQIVYRSASADVAFLKVTGGAGPAVTQAPVDRERFDALKEGDILCAVALEDGEPVRTEGTLVSPWIYLEDFALNMMLVRMDCSAGMSGCGLYDEGGCLAGILCGVDAEGEAAVLPLSVIESEWFMAQ